jgi:hypothetical protein
MELSFKPLYRKPPEMKTAGEPERPKDSLKGQPVYSFAVSCCGTQSNGRLAYTGFLNKKALLTHLTLWLCSCWVFVLASENAVSNYGALAHEAAFCDSVRGIACSRSGFPRLRNGHRLLTKQLSATS